jgi:hypothetical protein
MAIEYGRLPGHELASVAVTVKAKVPTALGVPVNAPVEDSDSPVGGAPAVTVNT